MLFLKIKSNQSGFLLMNLIWGSWSLVIMFNWYWWLHPHPSQFPSLQLMQTSQNSSSFPQSFLWTHSSLFLQCSSPLLYLKIVFLILQILYLCLGYMSLPFWSFLNLSRYHFFLQLFLSLCHLKPFPNIDGKNMYYSPLFHQLWFSGQYMQMFRFFSLS